MRITALMTACILISYCGKTTAQETVSKQDVEQIVEKKLSENNQTILKKIEESKDSDQIKVLKIIKQEKISIYKRQARENVVIKVEGIECPCDEKITKREKNKLLSKTKCKCITKDYDIDKLDVKIDSVLISTHIGEILSIQVFTTDGHFTNTEAPIVWSQKRYSQGDRLNEINGSQRFIVLNEVFDLIPYRSFFPDNSEVKLDSITTSATLHKSSGINAFIDTRLYSDALGILGGEDNGLAQVEFKCKFPVGHWHVPNTGFRFFKFIGFNLHSTKFDSESAVTDVSSDQFRRINLMQTNWLTAEMEFTVFHMWLSKKSQSTIDFAIAPGVQLSQIAQNQDTLTTVSKYVSGSLGLNFVVSDNFEINTSLIGQANFNSQLDQLNGQGYDRFFITPQVSAFWNPAKNKGSRIFGRINYNRDWMTETGEFVQIQIGYSMAFGEYVNSR